MNYQDVVNTLITLANSHKMIKTVGYGNITDLVNPVGQMDRNYPYMFINPSNMTLSQGKMVLRFNLIMQELCNDDAESVIKAQSESIQYIKDILAHLYYAYDFDFTLNFNIQPFQERFNDSVAGATATVELQIPQLLDDCTSPFEPQWEYLNERRTHQIHVLDFDGFPDSEDNIFNYFDYSEDGGLTWITTSSKIKGLGYNRFQPETSGNYKIEFNNICKFNEPEDGSGRLKYNIAIYPTPSPVIWESQFIDEPWISDDTIVTLTGTFEGYLTAGVEYFFYIGQNYATTPLADEIGYQQIGASVKVYKQA